MSDTRLTLLALPQFWNGTQIGLRVLVLPKGNPQEPLVLSAPSFAEANLRLDAVLVSGLEKMPTPGVETGRERLDFAPQVTAPRSSTRSQAFLPSQSLLGPSPPAPNDSYGPRRRGS